MRINPHLRKRHAKLAEYQINAVVTDDAFTSASTSADDVFLHEPIRMIIFSKTGKRIEMFSTKPNEKEVLFDKGTMFKVKDVSMVSLIHRRLDNAIEARKMYEGKI